MKPLAISHHGFTAFGLFNDQKHFGFDNEDIAFSVVKWYLKTHDDMTIWPWSSVIIDL